MTEAKIERAQQAQRPMAVGLFVNLGLAFVKAAGGILGHSYALIADAAESLGDVLTSGAVLFGIGYSVKPADEEHPYGHGKAEPIAAAFVALFLVGAAGWIASDSAHLILTPHQGPHLFTLAIVIAVAAVKYGLFRMQRKAGEEIDSSAVKAEAFHQRADVVVSLSVFVGITIALIGGKGYENADDWAALFASAVIAFNSFVLLSSAIGELLDKSPPIEMRNEIRTLATQVQGVIGTHKCLVRKMGLEFMVDLDILVDGSTSVRRAHDIAHEVQDHVRAQMPNVASVFVHVEPVDKPDRAPRKRA